MRDVPTLAGALACHAELRWEELAGHHHMSGTYVNLECFGRLNSFPGDQHIMECERLRRFLEVIGDRLISVVPFEGHAWVYYWEEPR